MNIIDCVFVFSHVIFSYLIKIKIHKYEILFKFKIHNFNHLQCVSYIQIPDQGTTM